MINPKGGVLGAARNTALAVIAALVAASALVSFGQSYRGLYDWARAHGLPREWAPTWPLMVDVFVAVGELALFVSLVDGWPRRSRWAGWAITFAGLAASVAGNVGHAAASDWATRLTWAVPPLAAAASLAVGLGVLKRVTAARRPVGKRLASDAPVGNRLASDTRSEIARARARRIEAERTRLHPATHAKAVEAYRASVEAGRPMSARQLATAHLGGNRRAAGRIIAAEGS